MTTNRPIRPNQSQSNQPQSNRNNQSQETIGIKEEIINEINGLNEGFKTYSMSELVQHTERFGSYLNREKLKTTQIRKFLDAINRLKFQLAQNNNNFDCIRDELIFLKPKLVYAAAKARVNQTNPGPVEPFSKVIITAIGKVDSSEDFNRLVQFVEAIIAYHKAAGGE